MLVKLLKIIPLFVFIFSSGLVAEEPKEENAQEQKVFLKTPPKLIKLEKVQLPKDAKFPQKEIIVLLKIKLNKEGKVQEASISKGAGEPFDSASLTAIKKFEFSPALLNTGEAVEVNINYKLKITEPAKKVVKKVEPPKFFEFELTIKQRGTRKPLSGALVVCEEKKKKKKVKSRADKKGLVTIKLELGKWHIKVIPVGHEKGTIILESNRENEKIDQTLYLESLGGENTTIIRSQKKEKIVVIRRIKKEDVMKAAGTAGDTLKIVANLPGSARGRFDGGGGLILRGSEPQDSFVFLEGQRIPLIYHFGGLRSTFNPVFLDELNYYPGNFGAEFGTITGGVVDIKVRDPADDLFRGQVDLNLYDAGLAMEGPITDKFSFGGAFHRSYVDSYLPYLIPDDAPISFDSVPRYYDYQFIGTYKVNKNHKVRGVYYGSMDKLKLIIKATDRDPKVRGALQTLVMFHKLQVKVESKLSKKLDQEILVYTGMNNIKVDIGQDFFFDLNVKDLGLRTEWNYKVNKNFKWRAGTDSKMGAVDISLSLPDRPKEGEKPVPVSTQSLKSVKETTNFYEPAAYVELEYRPIPEWILIPGLRYDGYSVINNNTWDPRLNTQYMIDDSLRLKAGIGLYQKRPEYDEADEQLGNPRLLPKRSVHASFGFEKAFEEYLTADLTVFYKWLSRWVVRDYTSPQSKLSNAGKGRVFGLEFLGRYNIPEISLGGWISYTFQRAFRKDQPDKDERVFDFDQPHNLTAVMNYRFNNQWSTGLRFRLVSGNPDTQINDAYYDNLSDTYVPIYGAVNEGRYKAFRQLDFRVDRVWTYDTWKLNAFLDFQNVLLLENQEGWRYNYDYTERQVLTGIPFLAILGVTAKW